MPASSSFCDRDTWLSWSPCEGDVQRRCGCGRLPLSLRVARKPAYSSVRPGFPGAHSQGETLDELNRNLAEVIEMLLEDGEPDMESLFVGTQTVQVA